MDFCALGQVVERQRDNTSVLGATDTVVSMVMPNSTRAWDISNEVTFKARNTGGGCYNGFVETALARGKAFLPLLLKGPLSMLCN